MILSTLQIKSINTDLELSERIRLGQFDSFVMIVPTNRKIRNLKRNIIDIAPGKT